MTGHSPQKDLSEYLEMIRTMRVRMSPTAAQAFRYTCTEDFLLQHGTFFTPQTLPARIRPMLPKNCFDNAYRLARRDKTLHYVEGYAMSVIPLLHGWCIDAEGRVVDPTWETPGTAYFGVELNLNKVAVSRRRGMLSLLDDYRQKYPALRGEFVFHPSAFFSTYEGLDFGPRPL